MTSDNGPTNLKLDKAFEPCPLADGDEADLTRPIMLAEIAPGRFNLIDGHHRVSRARRDGVATLPARRLSCHQHVQFLTTTDAYEKYVKYWNAKVDFPQRVISMIHRFEREQQKVGGVLCSEAPFSRVAEIWIPAFKSFM